MNNLEKFRFIKTVILDVDGVMTNSELIVMNDGQLLRKMSIRDGLAIKRAVQNRVRVAVISGGKSKGVARRLESLGVEDIYMGVEDKLAVYEDLVAKYNLNEEKILYMGDDLLDIEPMRRVGMPTCPKDAAHEVRELALYISPMEGGKGCVRDVLEKILRLKGKWLDKPRLTAKSAKNNSQD